MVELSSAEADKMPFARGYHIELGGGRGMPGAGVLGGYPSSFWVAGMAWS